MPNKEYEALVEKVAKAIYASRDGSNITPWLDLNCDYQARLLSDAQAAISTIRAALKDPSEHMLAEAMYLDRPIYVWRVMFAASALGEQSE